jgi:hypothetical protein
MALLALPGTYGGPDGRWFRPPGGSLERPRETVRSTPCKATGNLCRPLWRAIGPRDGQYRYSTPALERGPPEYGGGEAEAELWTLKNREI